MLKVERNFNDKYSKDKGLGCASDDKACVILHTQISDELKLASHHMETTNKIQKLRKATGLEVDDLVEVYYEINSTSKDSQILKSITENA